MLDRLVAWLKGLAGRERAGRESDEELQFHLEHETAANVARGMEPTEARLVALRALGDEAQVREAVRLTRRTWADTFVRDVRYALRHCLRDARGHTALTVFTLALGIGVTTAVFSIGDSVLWHRAPFPDADRLVQIWTEYPQVHGIGETFIASSATRGQVRAWREQADIFDAVEAFQSVLLVYQASSGAHVVRGASVTPGLLRLLGMTPRLGEISYNDDAYSGTDLKVVISHAFWTRHFAQSDQVVGQEMVFDGDRYTVAGVAPPTFRFPDSATEVWIPRSLASVSAAETETERTMHAVIPTFMTVARLRDDVGLDFERAGALVRTRGAAVNAQAGVTSSTGATLMPFAREAGTRTRQVLTLLGAGVGLLLLVICINAAALMLARAIARRPVALMKATLGASRWMLIRESIVEHALIGLAGGAGGLAMSSVVLRGAGSFLPAAVTSSLNPSDLDSRAVMFALTMGVLSFLAFAVPSVAVTGAAGASGVLRPGDRRASPSRRSRHLRTALIVAEVSLSLTLIVGTALMGRSLLALYATERGLDARGLVAVRVALPAAGYEGMPARVQFVAQATGILRGLPGVESVSSGDLPPSSSMKRLIGTLEIEGVGLVPQFFSSSLYVVEPDFFSTIGTPLLAGRSFSRDGIGESVVVNDAFARKYWTNAAAAVGRRFRIEDSSWRTIVGVVPDIRSLDPDEPTDAVQAYHLADVPYEGGIGIGMSAVSTLVDERTFVIRFGDGVASGQQMRDAINGLDRSVVVREIQSIDDIARAESSQIRFVFFLVSMSGLLALVISTMGLYGLLAHTVAQQRREIGIRLALGAAPAAIGRRVVARGVMVTGAGVVIGMAIAAASVDVIRAELYGVTPFDVPAVVIACVAIAAAAGLASWLPTRRAMQIDPAELLRAD